MDHFEIQRRLLAAGFDPGEIDGDIGPKTKAALKAFQKDRSLQVIDGRLTDETVAVLERVVMPAPKEKLDLTASWMPKAQMDGIVFHWTGGVYEPSGLDRSHYHFLVDGAANVIRGSKSITANVPPLVAGRYAAHTAQHNSRQIAVSACAMGGPKGTVSESPYKPGKYPLRREQFEVMAELGAILGTRYGIEPVPAKKGMVTHAEVQPRLGIKQKGKWDITRLPWDLSVVGHKAVGDLLRAKIKALM